MKKLFTTLLLLASTSLVASNYPNDYCNNLAVFKIQGPAVFGKISSGCMQSRYIIGYKENGILNGANAIDAVINVTRECYTDELATTEVIVKTLKPEWHGNGYMAEPITYNYTNINGCRIVKTSIAFNANGTWDSVYGNNYNFNLDDSQNAITYKSPNTSYGSVSNDTWNFIVDLME